MFLKRLFACYFCFTVCLWYASADTVIGVTYIGNEGFIIEGNNQKIIIDGIFSNGYGRYYVPTTQTLTQERGATSPFDSVDVLLVSHKHDDHINPAYVVEHLVNDLHATLICPDQVDELLQNQTNYASVRDRVVSIPYGTTRTDTTINGIKISVLPFKHPNNFITVNDLGYVIEINGVRIFHTGDAVSDDLSAYQAMNLAADSIDIAFFPRWFFNTEYGTLGTEIMQYIHPKLIIPMHIPIGSYAEYMSMADAIQGIPPTFFMETQQATYQFIKDQGIQLLSNHQPSVSEKKIEVTQSERGKLTVHFYNHPVRNARIDVFSPTGKHLFSNQYNQVQSVSVNLYNDHEPILFIRIMVDGVVYHRKIGQLN